MATGTITSPDVARLRHLRSREAIDHLDYLRALRDAAEQFSQRELARQLGVSQPAINTSLRSAAKVAPIREGFSGASPYEIAQRYAAGLIDRATVMDELARWPYEPMPEIPAASDFFDFEDEGTTEELARAWRHHLLDDQTYEAILRALPR